MKNNKRVKQPSSNVFKCKVEILAALMTIVAGAIAVIATFPTVSIQAKNDNEKQTLQRDFIIKNNSVFALQEVKIVSTVSNLEDAVGNKAIDLTMEDSFIGDIERGEELEYNASMDTTIDYRFDRKNLSKIDFHNALLCMTINYKYFLFPVSEHRGFYLDHTGKAKLQIGPAWKKYSWACKLQKDALTAVLSKKDEK